MFHLFICRVHLLKLGTVDKKEGFRVEAATGEPRWGCYWLTEVREKGPWGQDRFSGFAAHCSSGCKSHGDPRSFKKVGA